MMSKVEEKPPTKPVKYFCRGMVFPGMVLGVCAGLGALISIFSGRLSLTELEAAIRLGAAFGIVFSLLGVGDVIGGFLGEAKNLMNGIYQSLGYFLIWVFAMYVVLPAYF